MSTFHQISLLGERGLTPSEAALNLLPQTGAAVVATLAVGMLVDRCGTLHLGGIRGFVMGITVAWTALGPVAFGRVVDATGSYGPALLGAAGLPVAIAVAAVLVSPPTTVVPARHVPGSMRRTMDR